MKLNLNPKIFREYDIRGIAELDLSAEFARLLGRTFSQRVKAEPLNKNRSRPKVSVGRDCRLSGEAYADALINGFRSEGVDVVSLGVCPTPLTYFSLFDLDLDGAIMVTGSHNPSDYNGFKICLGKDSVHGQSIQELRHEMDTTQSTEAQGPQGDLESYDVITRYWDYVVDNIPRLKSKKIVLDAGNGTAATVAPELFKRLGAEVIPLFCELDGRFPNHHPDPTVIENLKDLRAKVAETQADFGVAFDGDSDRIGVVDEKGNVIFGDELMVILSREVLKKNPGAAIISEVKSSHRLYEDIAKRGGRPIMWKTGHSLIKSKLKEENAALAGEMSGHIFFADRYFGYDDAIYSAARLYEITANHDGPVSSLISDLPPVVATPEIRVDCSDEIKFQLVEGTKKRLQTQHSVNDIDGVRVSFHGGWGLVRASNTQPALVLRFEASDESQMSEFKKIVYDALNQTAKDLGQAEFAVQ